MSSSPATKRFPSSIGLRIAAGYSLLMLASFLVLLAIAYGFLAATLARSDRQQVVIELQSLRDSYLAGGVAAFEQTVLLNDRFRRNNPFFTRIDPWNGEVARVYFPQYWREFDLALLEQNSPLADGTWRHLPASDGDYELEVLGAAMADGFRFQVGISTEEREAALKRFRTTFAFALVPLMALGLAGGVLLAQRSLRPVRDMVRTVESIHRGNWDARAPRSGRGDELDDLGRLFNQMIERINGLVAAMKHALDAVAHDLRTPMTRFRNRAEEALQDRGDGPDCRRALQECVEESDQILRMLGMLMDISEAESGTLHLNRRPVDLSALAENVADMYRFVAEDKEIELVTNIAPGVHAVVDPERISQALANLLDNAVKYTPPRGRIDTALTLHDGQIVVQVSDTGPGLDPADGERIWQRLYRGRHDRTKGIGLGLSLVRAVITAHGGRAAAANRPEGGAIFTLTLPAHGENLPGLR